MDTREAYKERYEARIKEWGAKVDGIKANLQELKAQAKIDIAPHVDGVHEKYEAAKAKFARLADATDDKWNDVKKDADKAWHELEHSVEGALAAIKPHTKTPESKKSN